MAQKDVASQQAEVAPEQDLWFEIEEGKPWTGRGVKRFWVHFELIGRCSKCSIPLYANRSLPHKAFEEIKKQNGRVGLYDPDQDKWYCAEHAPKTKALYEHAGKCQLCGKDAYMYRTDGNGKRVEDDEHNRLLGNSRAIMKRTTTGEPPMVVCGDCEPYPKHDPGVAKANILLNTLGKIAGVPMQAGNKEELEVLMTLLKGSQ